MFSGFFPKPNQAITETVCLIGHSVDFLKLTHSHLYFRRKTLGISSQLPKELPLGIPLLKLSTY